MYPQSQDSNKPVIIGLAVLALLIVGGILLYVFVFKCKDDGGDCTTTSDCCEGLECIDSICSSPTPTVTPQPVAVANVVFSVPDPDLEPEPEPESTTCSVWDINNDCGPNTTITPGVVIGNSESECCVSALDCQGTWSECTAACEGIDGRTFTQTQAQFGTGTACPEATACQPGDGGCSASQVPPSAAAQDCILSEWTEYGSCSNQCGPGTMTRSRTIIEQPSNGGAACGELTQSQQCVGTECVDGDGWVVAESEEDCIQACGSINMQCQDGDWGVHSDTSMRDAIQAAGANSAVLCGDAPINSQSSAAGAPYIISGGTCLYRDSSSTIGEQHWNVSMGPESANTDVPPGVSTCAAKAWDYSRLCKCVSE